MHNIITLRNGMRIVYEHMPHVRSAAIGIWVGIGSRYEHMYEAGSSHFIEHMLFKGTRTHTAAQLADIMDGIGGQINAYTTRDTTCFYARVLDTHLDAAIELLGDMFFESVFNEEDVISERGVIFEEIDMYEDSGEDLSVEKMMRSTFKGALGKPILGTKKLLNNVTGESLRRFKMRNYVPSRMTISLCGSFTQAHLDFLSALFGRHLKNHPPKFVRCQYRPSFVIRRKPMEQNHLCLGFPSLAEGDSRRFALHALSTTLGGGMSSRLFQSIREKHGLCYSVYSFSTSYNETGLFGISTSLSRNSEMQAISLIRDELKKFCDEGITDDELYRANEQAKSSILMALESTSARMSRLGSSFTQLGDCLTADEVIERYDAVTRDDVLALAREIFDEEKMSFSAVGKVARGEDYKIALA